MRNAGQSKLGHHLLAAGLLLIAASAFAQDVVIQTSLLGRLESKRTATGSSIFVKTTSDWRQGRCRLRDGDTLEARITDVERRSSTNKQDRIELRFLPVTCAGNESQEIVPILVAIQAKPQVQDTSMLDRAALMTAFASMVGTVHSTPGGGSGGGLGQSNAGGRSMTAEGTLPDAKPSQLNAGDVRGYPGVKLTLPTLTLSPTGIASSRDMLFDPGAEFFLVVRTVSAHPSPTTLAASVPAGSAKAVASSTVALPPEPLELERCVEGGCALAESPAAHAEEQLERRLSLRSLGYKTRSNSVLRSLKEDAAVQFLGDDQLLVTFNAHPLIPRSADEVDARYYPRLIRALLISAKSGRVLRAEDWRVFGEGQYLWPLTDGRVLAHVAGSLVVYGPGLKAEQHWTLPGTLMALHVTPSRKLLVAVIAHERHTSEQHRRLAEFVGPKARSMKTTI